MLSRVIVSFGGLFVLLWMLPFHYANEPKFLLYTVNEYEGFNLRRDVYVRLANLLRVLRDSSQYPLKDVYRVNGSSYNWTLVLPPWSQTFHWKRQSSFASDGYSWSTFFNVEALKLFIPVIEYDDYLRLVASEKHSELDAAFYIKQFDLSQKQRSIWLQAPTVVQGSSGNEHFICDDQIIPNIVRGPNNKTYARFDSAMNGSSLKVNILHCLHGALHAVELAGFLSKYIEEHSNSRSLYIGAGENLINGVWSEWSQQYWTARRSMQFASHLTSLGDTFRRNVLNSTDIEDRTVPPPSWLYHPWPLSPALGGTYVCFHWRRGDFPHSPSAQAAAKQALHAIQHSEGLFRLKSSDQPINIYLATDAELADIIEFERLLSPYKVYRFTPKLSNGKYLQPGEVAIIDQWICAHARFFVGSALSTFTFRIAEEREIMGFPAVSTFNSFCALPDGGVVMMSDRGRSSKCEGLTPWPVVLEPRYTISMRKMAANQIKNEL